MRVCVCGFWHKVSLVSCVTHVKCVCSARLGRGRGNEIEIEIKTELKQRIVQSRARSGAKQPQACAVQHPFPAPPHGLRCINKTRP